SVRSELSDDPSTLLPFYRIGEGREAHEDGSSRNVWGCRALSERSPVSRSNVMKNYDGALRRISILFILVNLLSPLSTHYTLAQESTPVSDAPIEATVDADLPVEDPVTQDPPAQAPPVDPPAGESVQQAPELPAPEQQAPAQPAPAQAAPVQQDPPSQPEPQVVQQTVAPATGGLHIVLLDENGNLLPGGAFTIWDTNGARHDVADGGAGDKDYTRNGVIVVTDLLAGQV